MMILRIAAIAPWSEPLFRAQLVEHAHYPLHIMYSIIVGKNVGIDRLACMELAGGSGWDSAEALL